MARLQEFDRYRQPNDKKFKKVPENRDQGIFSNGTVKNEMVAMFINIFIQIVTTLLLFI